MKLFLFLIAFQTVFAAGYGQNASQPKSLGLIVSLPWVNSYSYFDYNAQKSSSKSGFGGLGSGIFYKVGKNKFSLIAGLTRDLPTPMGPIDFGKEEPRTSIGSKFSEITLHRQVISHVNMVLGINRVKYEFKYISNNSNTSSYSVFDKTAGLTFGVEYASDKFFSAALLYRPAVLYFDRKEYRHLISLDARFNISVWKKD